MQNTRENDMQRERSTSRTEGETRVPEVEERLNVQKREQQMGEVRVEKHVETRQETVPVELEREEVSVDRREVHERPLGQGEAQEAFQEGSIRVPVRGEEAVVSKQAVVTGEVVIDKERTTERQDVSGTVRRTSVEVDKDYDRHRPNFEQHFSRQNAGANRTFDQAEPYYQAGYSAGRDQRYQGRRFEDVESDLRTTHHTDGNDRWEDLREAVREGFNRARG